LRQLQKSLQKIALQSLHQSLTASASARFINRDRHAFAFQTKRGGQSRDASADDRDKFHEKKLPAPGIILPRIEHRLNTEFGQPKIFAVYGLVHLAFKPHG
jgi:hypothetical protein